MSHISDTLVEISNDIQQCLQDFLENQGDGFSQEDKELVQAQIKLNKDFAGPYRAARVKQFLKFVQSPVSEHSPETVGRIEMKLASSEELEKFETGSYLADECHDRSKIPVVLYFSSISQYGGRHLTLHRDTVSKVTPGSFLQGRWVKDLVELKEKTPMILGAIATMLLQGSKSQYFTREGVNAFYANLGGAVAMILVEYDASREKFVMVSNYPGFIKLKPTDFIFHLPQP